MEYRAKDAKNENQKHQKEKKEEQKKLEDQKCMAERSQQEENSLMKKPKRARRRKISDTVITTMTEGVATDSNGGAGTVWSCKKMQLFVASIIEFHNSSGSTASTGGTSEGENP